MNNRYIFRGKRKDNNEWVEGDLMQWNDGTMRICVEKGDDSKITRTVIPETVGQCTGLKDKNGKWIFEGDICKHRSNYSGNIVISVVTYTDGHFLALVCENSGFELSEKLEVIGNIYDDPELLEVER